MILSKPFDNGDLIDFDCSTATINPVVIVAEKPKGNFHLLEQRNVAIYSDNNALKLQIGEDVQNLSSGEAVIRYFHNVSRKTTCFEVESEGRITSIEYKAWWAEIPGFEPVEPEMDEDEDFMGYIYAVWNNKQLQQSLIATWA